MALIARETELAAVRDRLGAHRLVTIVGPGGIGKTALARAVADAEGPNYELGVHTVDLTRIDDPAGVRELIAGQLGFADFESLLNSPAEQPALIVVDNCEHVLDVAASAIDELLDACRMPTVLATSRSPLDVSEEVIEPLGPLRVPLSGDIHGDHGAVEMFVQRVRDFGGLVRPGDDEAIAEICRRLDGVPLAIELAAARSRTNTVDEILVEVARQPTGLARPRFRGRGAHRSVADMVEWSLPLLSEEARDAFERLGAMSGPFTVEMAAAVVGVPHPDTSSALAELVDASLVVADTSGARTWYRQLHPVRAVARERLRASGRLDEVVDRSVDHVVAVVTDLIADSSVGWNDQLTTLLDMYDHLIASLRWVIEHDERPERALILLAVLWGVVHQSHTAEVGAVGETALDTWPHRDSPLSADAEATVATCRYLLGDLSGAIDLATDALERVGASPFAPVSLRRVIAQANRASGNRELGREWFERAADAAIENGVHGFALEMRVDQALVTAELGDVDAALDLVDETIADAERRDASINLAWARAARGAILLAADDPHALDELVDAAEFSRSLAYPAGVAFSLRMIADARLRRDDDAGAAAALLELLDALLERGGLNELRMVLDHAASLLERADDPAWLDVATTAPSLPITTVGTALSPDVFERAAGRGERLSIRDLYRTCRERLVPIAEGASVRHSEVVDPPSATEPGAAGTSLVLEGDTWRWTYAGTSVVVKASKGMADLARLIAEPGREMSALDLMGSPKSGAGESSPTFDSQARHEIEDRIRELQSDVEEAEQYHDLARAERAAAELDRLVDELSAAVGLGGRARRTGSDPERARSAVTQRIRSTIKRIDRLHPKLGGHLAISIDTGTFCVYRPPEPTRWDIER